MSDSLGEAVKECVGVLRQLESDAQLLSSVYQKNQIASDRYLEGIATTRIRQLEVLQLLTQLTGKPETRWQKLLNE